MSVSLHSLVLTDAWNYAPVCAHSAVGALQMLIIIIIIILKYPR